MRRFTRGGTGARGRAWRAGEGEEGTYRRSVEARGSETVADRRGRVARSGRLESRAVRRRSAALGDRHAPRRRRFAGRSRGEHALHRALDHARAERENGRRRAHVHDVLRRRRVDLRLQKAHGCARPSAIARARNAPAPPRKKTLSGVHIKICSEISEVVSRVSSTLPRARLPRRPAAPAPAPPWRLPPPPRARPRRSPP